MRAGDRNTDDVGGGDGDKSEGGHVWRTAARSLQSISKDGRCGHGLAETFANPQYRLVVRITNAQVICQIVYAKLQGDFVFVHASSKELPKYGIKHGLTNWTACYATGLLVARRALTKLGLADKYEGVVEPTGELQLTEPRELRASQAGRGEAEGQGSGRQEIADRLCEEMRGLAEIDSGRSL
jgi:ribosomal protein L18